MRRGVGYYFRAHVSAKATQRALDIAWAVVLGLLGAWMAAQGI